MTLDIDQNGLIEATATIVSAYVTRNPVSPGELAKLIADTHAAMGSLGAPTPDSESSLTPAVSVKKSVTPDYLISLEDGRKFKSLKRHLSKLGMTPEEYRRKWKLPEDYPMVSATYSATRSSLAKANGLGQKLEGVETEVSPEPKSSTRKARGAKQ